MASVNQVILIGNLGRDVEMRYTPAGEPVGNFNVATTESWTDKKTGEVKEHTEWHRISLWGRVAENLQPYLVKGKQVYIEGAIRTRSWEKDGEKRYSTEIRANRVLLLGGGDRAKQATLPVETPAMATPDAVAAAYAPVTDEDIPF